MVEYIYTAHGEFMMTGDTALGCQNPYTYRGYYFDYETGLYFLKTRYYDPHVGRFISMDDVEYIDPQTIGGTNLYAYCNNNPVMYVDPTGNFSILALVLGITALVGLFGIRFKNSRGCINGIDLTTDKEFFESLENLVNQVREYILLMCRNYKNDMKEVGAILLLLVYKMTYKIWNEGTLRYSSVFAAL